VFDKVLTAIMPILGAVIGYLFAIATEITQAADTVSK